MDEVSSKIDVDEEFKEHINEKVLSSEASLEDEIILLEKYLYTGNERPEELRGETIDRAKLRSYLDILKNHRIAINELSEEADWDRSMHAPLLARVEYARLKDEEDTKNNKHYEMESEITIDYHQKVDEDREFTRESYVEAPGIAPGRGNYSEVKYYKGSNAASSMINEEKHEAKEDLDDREKELFGDKFLGYALTKGPTIYNVANEIKEFGDQFQEQEQQKHIVELKGHEEMASDLSVEIKLNKRDVPRTLHGESRHFQIYPTDETFEMLRRWEAIHDKYPDAIPYDASAVENRDWKEIHNVFGEIDDEQHEDLYEYIMNRNQSKNNQTIDDVEKELYHTDN